MRRTSACSSCLVLALAIPGCSKNSTAAESSSGTESETGAGEDDGGAPIDVPARGIRLSSVEVNQGVAIEIAREGAWVDGGSRNAPLVRDRDTLVRGFWAFDEGWEPRVIEARLNLWYADETTGEYRQQVLIDGPSAAGDIERTFFFGLLAEEVRPGTLFQMSLWETEAAFADGPDPDPLPLAPVEPNFIGIEDSPMEMWVHIVPFDAAWPGCSTTPDLSEPTLELFERRLYQRNPLIDLHVEIEDPITFTSTPSSFWEFFADIDDVRLASGDGPNHYWYGLVDPCANDLDGAGGLAMSIPPATQAAGRERIAAGLSAGADFSATTLIHEIGHLQGLRHVSCAQSPTDHDPGFPHEDATIGVWGFGIEDFGLRHPEVARDYMSYCYGNSWTADWSYFKNYLRIRTLTSWDYGGGAPAPEVVPLLVAVVPGPGSSAAASWWVSEGSIDPTDSRGAHADVVFHLGLDGGLDGGPDEEHRVSGRALPLADADAWSVAVPLPPTGLAGLAGLDQVDHVVVEAMGERVRVERANIR